jgi:hypothetical protein
MAIVKRKLRQRPDISDRSRTTTRQEELHQRGMIINVQPGSAQAMVHHGSPRAHLLSRWLSEVEMGQASVTDMRLFAKGTAFLCPKCD